MTAERLYQYNQALVKRRLAVPGKTAFSFSAFRGACVTRNVERGRKQRVGR